MLTLLLLGLRMAGDAFRTVVMCPEAHMDGLCFDMRVHQPTLSTCPLFCLRSRLESAVVDKRELLLHALALEHVAGGGPRPRFIAPPGRTGGPNAAGVEVEVTGSRALDVLEKLTTAILPQQVSEFVVESVEEWGTGHL